MCLKLVQPGNIDLNAPIQIPFINNSSDPNNKHRQKGKKKIIRIIESTYDYMYKIQLSFNTTHSS